MGPKLMSRCKLEPMGIQEYGKMLERIQVLEDGRVPAKEARSWRIEGRKEKNHKKRVSEASEQFEMDGFMAQKGQWNLAEEQILRKRGALLKEEGDAIREYKAMHEENFLSSWSRQDGRERGGRNGGNGK